VAVLVPLDEAEHQVLDVEGVTLDPMTVVPTQGLLVLDRVEESDVAGFVDVTPLGVKHALASKAFVIIISYMVTIACNIDPFKFKVEKQLLKTQILH
jgi:hypothetical protein